MNYIKILIRRDTNVNWTNSNPVLSLGEIAADMTEHRLKVGNGVTAWNDLDWIGPDVINDLLTGGTEDALSAEQGRYLKTLVDEKADQSEITKLREDISKLRQEITNIIESGSTTIFGMGYKVDSYNGYGKPTKVTFEDGVSADLTWSGTRLESIRASTGEVMTMSYNANGLITGRTITSGS